MTPSGGAKPNPFIADWVVLVYNPLLWLEFRRARFVGSHDSGVWSVLSVTENASKPEVSARLAGYFHRNGYVRRIDAVRRAEEGQLYKKGAEVRLVANSRAELAEIRRLLRQAGLEPGRPFAKGRQWRQPLYGVAAVARFLALVEDA